MIEVPEYACQTPQAFVQWLSLQAVWDIVPLAATAPYLVSCPLCAVVIMNDVEQKRLHGAFHTALVEFP